MHSCDGPKQRGDVALTRAFLLRLAFLLLASTSKCSVSGALRHSSNTCDQGGSQMSAAGMLGLQTALSEPETLRSCSNHAPQGNTDFCHSLSHMLGWSRAAAPGHSFYAASPFPPPPPPPPRASLFTHPRPLKGPCPQSMLLLTTANLLAMTTWHMRSHTCTCEHSRPSSP